MAIITTMACDLCGCSLIKTNNYFNKKNISKDSVFELILLDVSTNHKKVGAHLCKDCMKKLFSPLLKEESKGP